MIKSAQPVERINKNRRYTTMTIDLQDKKGETKQSPFFPHQ